MIRSISVLAAGIAFALAAGPVAANNKKVTDDDSVYSWGPWAVLAPAAGPRQVALRGLSTQNTPRNVKNTPQVENPVPVDQPPSGEVQGPCAAGAACGFATYSRDSAYVSAAGETAAQGYHGGPVPASFETSVAALVAAATNGGEGHAASYVVTPTNPADGSSPQVSVQNLPVAQTTPGGFVGSATDTTFHPALGPRSPAERFDHKSEVSGVLPYAANPDVVAGYWSDGTLHYEAYTVLATVDNIIYNRTPDHTGGAGQFVAGVTTPQADLDKLQAGNVLASYGGSMLASGTPVGITVDFGHGTWNGSWGHSTGALDTSGAHIEHLSNGDYLVGQVAFTASGTVSGANVVSSRLSDGLTGKVQGAFFGANAGALGGTVDVHTVIGGDNVRHTDVFLTGKGAAPGGAVR